MGAQAGVMSARPVLKEHDGTHWLPRLGIGPHALEAWEGYPPEHGVCTYHIPLLSVHIGYVPGRRKASKGREYSRTKHSHGLRGWEGVEKAEGVNLACSSEGRGGRVWLR